MGQLHSKITIARMLNVSIYFVNFLCRSLFIKHFLTPKLPMLDQLAEALKLYGVLELIRKQENEMRHVFTNSASSMPQMTR